MDRLVSVGAAEVAIAFRPSQRCSSAAFRVTNLMQTMAVAVHLTTTRPALFSLSPGPSAVLPPLSSHSFSLLLPPTDRPPLALPPDALYVRSAVLPTGKLSSSVARLFSRPGVHIFRDASLPIYLTGPHLLPSLLLLPDPDSIESAFLLTKSISTCSPPDLPSLLRASAAAGNSHFVSAILRAGANPTTIGADGRSALSLAVAAGSADSVRELISAGAGTEPSFFNEAAAAGRTDIISLLATADPDWVCDADVNGRTPVHAAAAAGAVGVLHLTLGQDGADPDRPDNRGWTPLHYAAAGGHKEAAVMIIEASAYDAKMALTKLLKKSAFDLAEEAGHEHMYGVLRLGDVLHAAGRNGDVRGVWESVGMGAEVDGRDQNGWTALHRAAFKGRVDVVRGLLEQGARMEVVDEDGYTPLRCAVEAGRVEAAICLAAHRARGGGMKGAEYLGRVKKGKKGGCCGGAVVVGMLQGEVRKLERS